MTKKSQHFKDTDTFIHTPCTPCTPVCRVCAHTLTHRACSLIGVDILLAVAWGGRVPFQRPSCGRSMVSKVFQNGSALAVNPVRCLQGPVGQQLAQQDQTSGRKVGKSKFCPEVVRRDCDTELCMKLHRRLHQRSQTARHTTSQTQESSESGLESAAEHFCSDKRRSDFDRKA